MLLAACGPSQRRLRMDQVLDIAWGALQPNTSSQNRTNWEVVEAAKVLGRDVVNLFSPNGLDRCPIPQPPENQAIRASSEYWYVRTKPIAAFPAGSGSSNPGEVSAPEPFIKTALFLIDPFTGQITARKFICGEP